MRVKHIFFFSDCYLSSALNILMAFAIFLSGCAGEYGTLASETEVGGDALATARTIAESSSFPPVEYENASQQGPPLVVLPGQLKITNQLFTQKYSANNIADFAEIELEKANFQVLERAHLGSLLHEVTLAVNMGDPNGLRNFRKGKFISTRWFIQFDVLKAEPVAQAGTSFDGKALGNLISTISGDKLGGRAAGGLISSVGGSEEAQVWIVGMKYKIIDAANSAIVKNQYIEEKMEVGGSSASFLGLSQTEQSVISMDSMVQRLVQKCVAEIDKAKGISSSYATNGTYQPSDKKLASEKEAVGVDPVRMVEARVSDGSKSHQSADQSVSCQELRKDWQLGDSSKMQQYLRECAK